MKISLAFVLEKGGHSSNQIYPLSSSTFLPFDSEDGSIALFKWTNKISLNIYDSNVEYPLYDFIPHQLPFCALLVLSIILVLSPESIFHALQPMTEINKEKSMARRQNKTDHPLM